MYQLFYYPSNASLLPHMMLHEIGAAHELVLVDRTREAHKAAEYLRMNPNGLIPVLIDGDATLYETAAIALYLTEKHPEAGLAPLPGETGRADFLRWMVHLTNTPQAEFQPWFYPHKFADGAAAQADVKEIGRHRMERNFERIAGALGEGPYLLGERFSAADLFLFMLIRWGRAMPRPPREMPRLSALAARVVERPGVLAALAAEGIERPFY